MSVTNLKRYPYHPKNLLQAWDSADELLLQHVKQGDFQGKRIAIINDSFGALSCGLEGAEITSYTDSYSSARAIQINSQDRITPIHELDGLTGTYDLVLIRIP